jgi:hypothetical protein
VVPWHETESVVRVLLARLESEDARIWKDVHGPDDSPLVVVTSEKSASVRHVASRIGVVWKRLPRVADSIRLSTAVPWPCDSG